MTKQRKYISGKILLWCRKKTRCFSTKTIAIFNLWLKSPSINLDKWCFFLSQRLKYTFNYVYEIYIQYHIYCLYIRISYFWKLYHDDLLINEKTLVFFYKDLIFFLKHLFFLLVIRFTLGLLHRAEKSIAWLKKISGNCDNYTPRNRKNDINSKILLRYSE